MAGYKMPIVCKEVILPLEKGDDLTIEQYKEKYGIDIREVMDITISGSQIVIYLKPFINVLFCSLESIGFAPSIVSRPIDGQVQEYDEGVNDGMYEFIFGLNYGWRYQIVCPKDKEFTLENVKIKYQEI